VPVALRQTVLQVFRIVTLIAIAWIMREHHLRVERDADAPLSAEEVRVILPETAALEPDRSEKNGLTVLDAAGKPIGLAIRTLPEAGKIVGYRGWTDCLVLLDPALRVIAVRIRNSQDTREHVSDIREDRAFLRSWNGRTWNELLNLDARDAGIDGVSGASMTSEAIVEGILRRIQSTRDTAQSRAEKGTLRWRLADTLLAAITGAGIWLAFKGSHGRPWLRRAFQCVVVLYVGFLGGHLLSLSVLTGWIHSGLPWSTGSGLVLLGTAALMVPAVSGKPLYCQHLCPHGVLQEWVHLAANGRWRIDIPARASRVLRLIAPLLIAVGTGWVILHAPFEIAHIEPFDAYMIRTAGIATITIAILGIIASAFVPMGFCRYACPTGAVLNFIRNRGSADRFSTRDTAALLMTLTAILLSQFHKPIIDWILSDL
jgi:hypothetical protein